MASYTVTYFADFVHGCASATYQLVLVRYMAWICMRPSLAGWGSPEIFSFLGCGREYSGSTYYEYEYERTQPENCGFLAYS